MWVKAKQIHYARAIPEYKLAATPLEASRGPWKWEGQVKKGFKHFGGLFSKSENRNLPRTYKKLPCNGEPYQFSMVHTHRQTDTQTKILLLYYKDHIQHKYNDINNELKYLE